MAGFAKVDEFSRNFDEEFCLIACMESTTGSNIWYIDSGASSHMTEQKRFFRDLQEGGTRIHVVWVIMHAIRRRELALFHLRGSLANPAILLMCYMFQD